MFEQVTAAPPDSILGLTEAFKKDARPEKLNLSVGVFKDDKGRTPVLKCVKEAERRLLEGESSKTYLSIEGSPEYGRAVRELMFGADHEIVRSNRACTAQCPGGTGALRVAADFEGEVGVLLDEENGDAVGFINLHDLLENRADEAWGDAEGRLVEHEELRVAHERAADGEHLLFAAGECAGGLFDALLQAGENAEDVIAVFCDEGGVVLEVGAHREIFVDGEVGENHATLGDVAEAAGDDFVRGEGGDIFAEEGDGAALGAEEAGDGAERGGFPGPVATDERDDGALLDLEGDAAEGADGTVGNGEVGDGEHRLSEGRGRSGGLRRGRLR